MNTSIPPRTTPDSAPPQSTWAAGDYPAMAGRLVPAAERAVAVAAIAAPAPRTTVLDVGCGTGNAALAAARAGAAVTAVDPTPELLAVAARRARAENLTVTFRQTDADHLTGRYDRVLTVFGAMYAPDHTRTAEALLRCCAPGGRIVSAAWTPDGLMAALNRAAARYLPPPPQGGRPPVLWGDEAHVRGLFAGHDVTVAAKHVPFVFPSPREAAAFWVRTAGHVQLERPRLQADGSWEALHDDLAAVFGTWNRNGTGGRDAEVRVEAAYLLAVIVPARPA
ncbi:class I SAM-dependent methyltransferase [Streptomyces sp. URMC 126]|uniref:class I SAM-dependent methyltransferase n=1 Tax=Streptomyces sp. URMC 126 TaxID=3423401 RepID=UPI003F1939B7